MAKLYASAYPKESLSWILHSECTAHVCFDRMLLITYEPVADMNIETGTTATAEDSVEEKLFRVCNLGPTALVKDRRVFYTFYHSDNCNYSCRLSTQTIWKWLMAENALFIRIIWRPQLLSSMALYMSFDARKCQWSLVKSFSHP